MATLLIQLIQVAQKWHMHRKYFTFRNFTTMNCAWLILFSYLACTLIFVFVNPGCRDIFEKRSVHQNYYVLKFYLILNLLWSTCMSYSGWLLSYSSSTLCQIHRETFELFCLKQNQITIEMLFLLLSDNTRNIFIQYNRLYQTQ